MPLDAGTALTTAPPRLLCHRAIEMSGRHLNAAQSPRAIRIAAIDGLRLRPLEIAAGAAIDRANSPPDALVQPAQLHVPGPGQSTVPVPPPLQGPRAGGAGHD